ncbi:MAG: asparagine synthase (glutamine-hydrolyzing) [Opitutaceae bacterium]|nr:asparagine synthase (glutamine-hydrolyzing) [Opitutaceae bacterium]
MCGIAGFISTREGSASRREAVQRMCDRMQYRGPDDSGIVTQQEATLGIRRLAIFDPANGRQPMRSPDGRHTLVFNGAIYNHRELRVELEACGHVFRTRCDTEVLLHALARWGEASLARVRGMFAFALWDDHDRTLTLARDPLGIKPLYYHWRDDAGLLFSSELASLLASKFVPVEIDPQAISVYLSHLAVPAPQTIYRQVRCLRPGQIGVWRDNRLWIRSYWTYRQAPAERSYRTQKYGEFVVELRRRLEETVRVHAQADVSVGAFLSGGLDSGALVALLSRQTNGRLKTFTLAFREKGFSEQAAARRMARHAGTAHHEELITGDRVADKLPEIIRRMDQPTGDGINTFFASSLAADNGVKVVVSGVGGDELFGGYPSFRDLPRFVRFLPYWRSVPVKIRRHLVGWLRAHGTVRSLKLADFLTHARDLNELASLQRTVFSEAARLPLLAPEIRREVARLGPMHPMLDEFAFELHAAEPLRTVSAWEMRTYMTDVLLSDSDVFSMAHSLELRTPFVDTSLVRWLWGQPEAFVFASHRYKGALRDAVIDLLPPASVQGTKVGFTLPFPIWMRGPLRPFLDETFSAVSLARCPWLEPGPIREFWRHFQRSTDTRNWSRVWSLAMLIAFLQRHSA